jgi:hypothetical protein
LGSAQIYLDSVPVPTAFSLAAPVRLPNGQFQFSFTNTPGAKFTAWASAIVTAPLSNWVSLGAVIETSAGQFQFADTGATNQPVRFYRVVSN